MGGTQRVAAVAAASHARHYNHTQDVTSTQTTHYNVNIFFVSATLCGVLVAVCAGCWRRSPLTYKPEEEVRGVYTISADVTLHQIQEDPPGPPPAYDMVVNPRAPELFKDCVLEEILTDPCHHCGTSQRCDSGLPSYEAAVRLTDTNL